jgi:aminoglycoside phosphotransferase (APT) family kinase protein
VEVVDHVPKVRPQLEHVQFHGRVTFGTMRTDSLTRALGHPVRPWRAGTDFWADLVETPNGPAVVRSPRISLAQTTYDGLVDFGEVIEKEAAALRLMAAAGLPVPDVLGFRRADPSWILLSHVPHDPDAAVPLVQLGELTGRLHSIRPGWPSPPSWAGFVRSRLELRLTAARAYCPDLPDLGDGVTELLTTREEHATSLLHMDLRPANICVRDGRIVALIDLANCLTGDPLMELGRIRSYGLLTEAFLAGYGREDFSPDERALLDIYELDTALLLTVVSVEEFDDPTLHQRQRDRSMELTKRLVAMPAR